MKKFVFYIWSLLLVMVLVFTYGCSCGANVPVRYPEIELPPAKGQNTMAVIDDIIEVPANELWHKTITIPSKLERVKLAGWFTASGGARNDIKVLVLNDIDFHNYRNFGKIKGLYESEKTTVDNFTVELETPGKYHLVISNWFSEFSNKKVIAKIYLYWSLPPVEYLISRDGVEYFNSPDGSEPESGIPASSNVTFLLRDIGEVHTQNFTITRKEDGKTAIPFTANEIVPNLQFVALPVDDYRLTCDNCTPKINVEFSVIPAAIIGQGFLVSSSMSNSPPKIIVYKPAPIQKENILVNSTILTVKAEDPDDDVLTFYAFNLPMSKSTDDKSRIIWGPAAKLDKNTGELNWNVSYENENLRSGNYTVRFEVTDGILSDYQDVVIEIN